ncbi:MAG: hypothetical protein AAF970_00835 [Bacteroidota bacterium]
MASSSQGVRIAIQVVLAVVIVGLVYFLYVSITEPYEAIQRQEELTELTRERMEQVRTAMIHYEERNDRFPVTLDSLRTFVRDSLTQVQRDSLFDGELMTIDSLGFSARRSVQFALSFNDTLQVNTYLLEDPDSDDYIGTLNDDPTQVNAASWE